MSTEDIINYITQTPENTNPNIIRDLLNKSIEKLIVNISYDNGNVISDKTANEIFNAVKYRIWYERVSL